MDWQAESEVPRKEVP